MIVKKMFLDVDGKTGRDGDDWMSVGSEFHRSDAATGKERRPTVVGKNGGTSSCSDDKKNEVGGDRVSQRR